MTVNLHLFSTPGKGDIQSIIDACRPYLQNQSRPVLGFMQWASVQHDWLPYTREVFSGLAEVLAFNPDPMALAQNQEILVRCGAVYISGGNTYLLNHILNVSGVLAPLRERALAGLPVAGFSAGAILCGPNILTTHDINMVPSPHFDGLDLLPYNLVAHYPSDDPARSDEDDWLSDYHARHANPILALENDAYVRWDGSALERVAGRAWILSAGQARSELA